MSAQKYINTLEYNNDTGQFDSVRRLNPHYDPDHKDRNDGFLLALMALPFVLAWNVIHGFANPHSRPTYLRWGAVLLFLTLGVPLLFGLGSLVMVTILKPHMMLSHLPELWAAIQHAL